MLGRFQQLIVRDAAPEEEGEPRRELDIADAMGAGGCRAARILLDAKQEFRRHEKRLERLFDAVIEIAVAASAFVKREQWLDVCRRDRSPKCPVQQRRQDRTRARRFILRARRPADEDPGATRRLSACRWIVRPADGDVVHLDACAALRQLEQFQPRAVQPQIHADLRRGWRSARRLVFVLRRVLQERHAQRAQTGFDRQPHFEPASVIGLNASGRDANLVFRVERKVVLEGKAASRTKRQIVAHPFIPPGQAELRVSRWLELLHDRLHLDVADRQPADLSGGRQIPLEQRRRRRQHVGDVVEAVAGVVYRQPRSRFDVEREQIANCVAVFSSIEPVDGRPAGIRMCRRVLVEGALEPRRERGRCRRVRPRLSSGRHLTASHLAQHALQHVGMVARPGEIDGAQRDAGRS